MPNQRIEGHPLVGARRTYRGKYYDPAVDKKPGSLVVGYGHHVEILAVFTNWNDVAGLDMLYVRCEETGQPTHVTPADLGLTPLSELAPKH